MAINQRFPNEIKYAWRLIRGSLGSGTNQARDLSKIQEAQQQFDNAKRTLSANATNLKLPRGDWRLKRSWLDDNYKSDVSSLTEWIEYATSPHGNSASISKYFDLDNPDFKDIDFLSEYLEAGRSFRQIFDCLYGVNSSGVDRNSKCDLQDVSLPSNLQHIARAIITKPFAILTGASGTGKTKLAESLAAYPFPSA